MNPQTAVRACSSSSSSSCVVLRIYRAKQTNSKNKWINTHCGSAGVYECVCEYVCVCVWASECACLLLFVCLRTRLCVYLWTSECVCHRLLHLFFCLSAAASGVNGCCVCASLELKLDLCYSTTRWQNAAILQTEPTLGWPSYCNASSHSTQFVWHWM